MEPFRVHILGCGSATPNPRHYTSSQIVEIRGKFFMIDCGEGTQMQLYKTHINFSKFNAVFISHLHGDHCFGLIGMICSFGLLGRIAPFHIYAPEELFPMFEMQQRMFCHDLGFEIVQHPIDTTVSETIYDDRSLTVQTIPLDHRVPCCGFLFKEKPTLPHIRRDMIDFYQIPVSQIANIKNGADWTTSEGEVVPNERLTSPPDAPRSYAYCSDTRYMPELFRQLKGVNMLYHEATYADDYLPNACKYYHSTARQAAQVARDAGVGQLLLGHYSARYKDENLLLQEAKEVFPDTFLTNEMKVFNVK